MPFPKSYIIGIDERIQRIVDASGPGGVTITEAAGLAGVRIGTAKYSLRRRLLLGAVGRKWDGHAMLGRYKYITGNGVPRPFVSVYSDGRPAPRGEDDPVQAEISEVLRTRK